VVAADPDGDRCDVPAILLTRLSSHPPRPADTSDADGFCRQLAETLALIHDLPDAGAHIPPVPPLLLPGARGPGSLDAPHASLAAGHRAVRQPAPRTA
jgi:hypothetical protein